MMTGKQGITLLVTFLFGYSSPIIDDDVLSQTVMEKFFSPKNAA